MIQAGAAIDANLSVIFGFSTLTAAGFGQIVSDVAGFTSGGLVDAAVSKLKLPHHNLTPDQLDQRVCRVYNTLGGCVGVVIGCLLGMSCLLFMDTDKADRVKKAKALQSIFESIMDEGHTLVQADRATLWMLDEERGELWSRVATGVDGTIIKVPSNAGIAGACSTTGAVVNVPDAYHDGRFNRDVDATTGYHTRSVLAVPVKDEEGKVIGVIQMMNKTAENGSEAAFDTSDEKLVQMLASHVSSFIRIVND
jgi:Transmembrane protein 65/GAF domain